MDTKHLSQPLNTGRPFRSALAALLACSLLSVAPCLTAIAADNSAAPSPAPVMLAPGKHQGDGVVMSDGGLAEVRGNHATRINHEVQLQNGIRISPGGTIYFKDGTTATLEDKHLLTFDGKITTASPAALSAATAALDAGTQGATNRPVPIVPNTEMATPAPATQAAMPNAAFPANAAPQQVPPSAAFNSNPGYNNDQGNVAVSVPPSGVISGATPAAPVNGVLPASAATPASPAAAATPVGPTVNPVTGAHRSAEDEVANERQEQKNNAILNHVPATNP